MATRSKAVVYKPWRLTKTETLTTFEDWKAIMINSLKQDSDFKPLLKPNMKWQKKKKSLHRGFTNDKSAQGLTREDKADILEQMLSAIASFCPVISRKAIVDDSRSVKEVWHTIRLHYNIQTSGANFLDFVNINLEPDEKPEDLYQRMSAFISDNLLKKSSDDPIIHDEDDEDDVRNDDEVLSPSLENLVVLLWLQKLHPRLPDIVKQKYAAELKNRTLFNLKPEISMSIPVLLEDADNSEAKINRSAADTRNYRNNLQHKNFRGNKFSNRSTYNNQRKTPQNTPNCALCQQANRQNTNHFMSKCRFLPEADRKYMAVARQITSIVNDEDNDPDDFAVGDDSHYETTDEHAEPQISTRMVMIKSSPYIDLYHKSTPVRITLDSGAEGDMIRRDVAVALGVEIRKSTHHASTANGNPMNVVGETSIVFSRDGREFEFNGLVVNNLDAEVLGSVPFQHRNDITLRIKKNSVILDDGTVYKYGSSAKSADSPSKQRRVRMLRANASTTVWPGEYIDIPVPDDVDEELAIEPRDPESDGIWLQASIKRAVGHSVRLTNTSTSPQIVKKHDHIGQFTSVYSPECETEIPTSNQIKRSSPLDCFTSPIKVNPNNILDSKQTNEFKNLHDRFNTVFDPNFGVYNHAFGHFEAKVHMGSVQPPQRKGKLPFYHRERLSQLQDHIDELDHLGVLQDPHSADVSIEYLNPSFLVKKPQPPSSKEEKFRMVTAFGEVGKYCKSQP